jgi:hypothetical protein
MLPSYILFKFNPPIQIIEENLFQNKSNINLIYDSMLILKVEHSLTCLIDLKIYFIELYFS